MAPSKLNMKHNSSGAWVPKSRSEIATPTKASPGVVDDGEETAVDSWASSASSVSDDSPYGGSSSANESPTVTPVLPIATADSAVQLPIPTRERAPTELTKLSTKAALFIPSNPCSAACSPVARHRTSAPSFDVGTPTSGATELSSSAALFVPNAALTQPEVSSAERQYPLTARSMLTRAVSDAFSQFGYPFEVDAPVPVSGAPAGMPVMEAEVRLHVPGPVGLVDPFVSMTATMSLQQALEAQGPQVAMQSTDVTQGLLTFQYADLAPQQCCWSHFNLGYCTRPNCRWPHATPSLIALRIVFHGTGIDDIFLPQAAVESPVYKRKSKPCPEAFVPTSVEDMMKSLTAELAKPKSKARAQPEPLSEKVDSAPSRSAQFLEAQKAVATPPSCRRAPEADNKKSWADLYEDDDELDEGLSCWSLTSPVHEVEESSSSDDSPTNSHSSNSTACSSPSISPSTPKEAKAGKVAKKASKGKALPQWIPKATRCNELVEEHQGWVR